MANDIGASVLAKLRNKAKATNKSYQQCLQLFFQEEFLRRVAKSKYADNLVLKGGLFIYTLTNFESRATIDIDFLLRQQSNAIDDVEKMINQIISIDTGNEFVSFEAKNFEMISPQRKYKGISTQIIGHINQVRIPFNIDIGVGDVIVPRAEKRKIALQLDGFEALEISTYSLESTIAEKFDAILQRLELTSRMKDFYDINYLANTFDFDGRKLQEAIIETLQNRGTSFEKNSMKNIMSFSDDSDMNIKWNFFLRNLKITEPKFEDVLQAINAFLSPIYQAIIDEKEFFMQWNCNNASWK